MQAIALDASAIRLRLRVGCDDFRKQKATGQRFSAINPHNNLLIKVQTPKYHIYIEYAEPEKGGIRDSTLPERNSSVPSPTPFTEGKPFWFMGRLLNPLKVTKTSPVLVI